MVDGKTTYAQSSDIKARSYLEYRKDMKKKAIVELEILEWLENKLKELNPKKSVSVYKSGGDKFLWFLRQGGISREPDFIAEIDGQKLEIEFQYGSDISINSIFDFKTSKVGQKVRGKKKRLPKDLVLLYLFRHEPTKFAFLPAEWIIKNGVEGVAPAWGNREVYKVKGSKMITKVKTDNKLEKVWNSINAKLFLLNFQNELININKELLSSELQQVIDEEKIVKIVPKDLDSFFKVCFILDNLNKIPKNTNLWLIYLLSYANQKNSLQDIFKLIYCLDFLYSKVSELKQNELLAVIKTVKDSIARIKRFYQKDGSYASSLKISTLEETRYAVFSVNLLEDLIQDIMHYYGTRELKPISKIYESLNDAIKTYNLVHKHYPN